MPAKICIVGARTDEGKTGIAVCEDWRKMKDWVENEDIQECGKFFQWLHLHPEESGCEYETSKYVSTVLKEEGYRIIQVSNTGFIAFLDLGCRETIALRAELDALQISGDYWEDDIPGKIVHACGHDGHMAMLMTTGKILARKRDCLKTNVALLFEEGEEKGLGNEALRIAMEPLGIKSVWGLHVEPEVESGKIALVPGMIMAGDTDIEIRLVGEGGHASRPDQCRNPINAAGELIQAVRSMWMDETTPGTAVSFSFTKIQGGKELNVVPDEVILGGSLRFFDKETAKTVISKIKERASHIAAMNECRVIFSDSMEIYGDITWNDPELCKKVRRVMEDYGLQERLTRLPPLYSSESFAHFSKKYPSLYVFLGNGRKGEEIPLHSRWFEADPSNFELGIQAALCFVEAESVRQEI